MLPLLLIAIPLIVVVILVANRVNYGLALLVGAIAIAIVSAMNVYEFIEIVFSTIIDLETLELTAIVALIQLLALCMSESGMIERLIQSIRSVLPAKYILAILPAIMGSLPMPGGALLSAPMIEDTANKLGLDSDEKSFINVWFRHWNFFVYPLSSAIILASTLANVNLYRLIAVQLPVLLLYVCIGYVASLRSIARVEDYSKSRVDRSSLYRILLGISPILIAVILTIAGFNMALALIVAVVYTIAINRIGLEKVRYILRKINVAIPLAIPSVMIFRYTLKRSGLVEAAIPYFSYSQLPPLIIALSITWIIGLATAMPSAGIALAFPIASAIVGNMSVSTASSIYISIIFSYLISPLHLCLILTVGYYRSEILSVYKRLVPSAIVAYLSSLIILSFL